MKQAESGVVPSGTADFISHPYLLPTDVFDLPRFDKYRVAGKLDFGRAQSELEKLSDDDLPAAQVLFDLTAWKAFVALNWPAMQDGTADPRGTFEDSATKKVWEYWRGTTSIFLINGAAPAPWSVKSAPDLDHFKAGWRASAVADEGKQAFSGPLVDQNYNWVHYQSLVNHEEFDFLVGNKLYNQEGQADYLRDHGNVEFPVNDDNRHGAIEIKMAWKMLTPSEERSHRFLVRRIPVEIYRPSGSAEEVAPAHKSGRTSDNTIDHGNVNGDPCTDPAVTSDTRVCETVGLIGMHIAMRTRSSPQWIWATFEQIDNTRLDPHSGDPAHPLPSKPSLSNPDDPEALVLANVLPGYNADGTHPDGTPVQDWDERKQSNPKSRLGRVEVLRVVPLRLEPLQSIG
jgi:hypothetical protein